MKRNILQFAMGLTAVLFAACTDGYDTMNTDRHTSTEVSPVYTLPYVQETLAHVDCAPYQRGDNLYAQMYCQYYTDVHAGWSSDRYGYVDSWVSPGYWEPYYLSLKHLKVLKAELATHANYTNVCQMMRIITAYGTIVNTDIFGDMPYFDAATGENAPKYDAQKDIYYDVFDELAEAVKVLGQNLPDQDACTANNDLMFGGDVRKWIRFANSLRLRAAMRLSFVDPEKARSEGEAALAGGVMQSNDDNAAVLCSATSSAGWGHPLYMMATWNGFVMSKTMENIFKNTGTVPDPRMPLWFGKSYNAVKDPTHYKGDAFKGAPCGMTDLQKTEQDADGFAPNSALNNSQPWGLRAFPEWNTNGTPVENTVIVMPLQIMTHAEVCFLEAEAAIRGWSGAGDAKTHYESGIRASFADARSVVAAGLYSTADDDTYVTTGNAAWNDSDSFETKLRKIITQKWIALYPNGNEAWAECRRTGYPELMPVQQSVDTGIDPAKGEFVKKIRYTDSERRDNPNSLAGSLNQGKGDGMNVRVWWDTARYK